MRITPAARTLQGWDDLEMLWAAIRDEMIRGFEGVHRRLDLLNGRVATQGENIASLSTTVAHTEAVAEDLRDLEQTLAAHRARCPYDMGGDLTANAPRWSNACMRSLRAPQ